MFNIYQIGDVRLPLDMQLSGFSTDMDFSFDTSLTKLPSFPGSFSTSNPTSIMEKLTYKVKGQLIHAPDRLESVESQLSRLKRLVGVPSVDLIAFMTNPEHHSGQPNNNNPIVWLHSLGRLDKIDHDVSYGPKKINQDDYMPVVLTVTAFQYWTALSRVAWEWHAHSKPPYYLDRPPKDTLEPNIHPTYLREVIANKDPQSGFVRVPDVADVELPDNLYDRVVYPVLMNLDPSLGLIGQTITEAPLIMSGREGQVFTIPRFKPIEVPPTGGLLATPQRNLLQNPEFELVAAPWSVSNPLIHSIQDDGIRITYPVGSTDQGFLSQYIDYDIPANSHLEVYIEVSNLSEASRFFVVGMTNLEITDEILFAPMVVPPHASHMTFVFRGNNATHWLTSRLLIHIENNSYDSDPFVIHGVSFHRRDNLRFPITSKSSIRVNPQMLRVDLYDEDVPRSGVYRYPFKSTQDRLLIMYNGKTLEDVWQAQDMYGALDIYRDADNPGTLTFIWSANSIYQAPYFSLERTFLDAGNINTALLLPSVWGKQAGRHKDAAWTAVGSDWQRGRLSYTYDVDPEAHRWSAPPGAYYQFTLLPKAGTITIAVETHDRFFSRKTNTAVIDLAALNAQLIDAGLGGFKLRDRLVVGETVRQPGFILRDNVMLPITPAVSFDGSYPGEMNTGHSRVTVTVPSTNTQFAYWHPFRTF